MAKLSVTQHPLLIESQKITQKPKPHKTPERHQGVVHAVGFYPNHLRHAKSFWNNLNKMIPETQVSASLSKQMETKVS